MVATKFLNPRNDLAFKKIFGSEKNQDILIHFLNDLLDRPSPIREITFLTTIQEPEIAALRVSIVDVMCQDQDGNRFIIEMQLSREKGFDRRALYYAAKAYCGQRKREDAASKDKPLLYEELSDVYFLAITNFAPFPHKKSWLSRIGLKDLETNEHDIQGIQLLFLQLPLFSKKKRELKTVREKWAYFLKYGEDTREEDLQEIVGTDLIIQKAYEELDRYHWSEKELIAYDSIEMKQAADRAVLAAALEDGEKLGLEKGEKLGLEKGEKNRNRAIALAMLGKGMDLTLISEITTIPLDELRLMTAEKVE